MSAPLNDHAFAPVPVVYLRAVVEAHKPIGIVTLWGLISLNMGNDGSPAKFTEKDLGLRLGCGSRTIGRWLKYLRERKPPWIASQERLGFSNLYSALLPDEKPRGGMTPMSSPPKAGARGDTTPTSRPLLRENRTETEEERENERLLSLSFSSRPTKKQKGPMLDTVAEGRRCHVPLPFLAHALISTRTSGAPWKRLDTAIDMARKIIKAVNGAQRKQFTDLQHIAEFAAGGGELPRAVKVDGEEISVKAVVTQCTEWPEPAEVRA